MPGWKWLAASREGHSVSETVEIKSDVLIDCLSGDLAALVGRLGVVVEEGRSGNKGVFPFPCLHSLPRTAA